MIKKVILWSLALGQAGAAIAWSLGYGWAYGPFVVLVITLTVVYAILAALGGGILLVLKVIDDDLGSGEWKDLDLSELSEILSHLWRRGLFRLIDLLAITALTVTGHPWWALVYLPQVFSEMALVKSVQVVLRMAEQAREGEDRKGG